MSLDDKKDATAKGMHSKKQLQNVHERLFKLRNRQRYAELKGDQVLLSRVKQELKETLGPQTKSATREAEGFVRKNQSAADRRAQFQNKRKNQTKAVQRERSRD